MIDYSKRLIDNIAKLQEAANTLLDKYHTMKRSTQKNERVDLVSEVMDDILECRD